MADWIQAIGTILAVFVAVAIPAFQMYKDSKRNNEARIEDRYYSLRHNAFLVDSWITRSKEGWKICIVNGSEGVIRDIQVHVQWPELDTAHDTQLDCEDLHVAPKTQKPWRTLLPGTWLISPKPTTGNLRYSSWNYPVRKSSQEELPSPAFFDSKSDNHALIALKFTDVFDNTWVRIYSCVPQDCGIRPGLYLLATSDQRLQKYTRTIPFLNAQ
ncbi:hypothetical protein OZX72_02840 [Bifidobacterium sp. ESL0769]|uniref:hypothetical protein n=1 Tax=Bifidobacterium sp. ESL0769 TaxID=2983229 RepID=UPI0023F6517A|nr:hypothetical protein [Bifidobacterium sp. ESL0769]WEV67938.1 hypothetical protein OZX72_02840 [Bifidobacterium sp. ESL0769]